METHGFLFVSAAVMNDMPQGFGRLLRKQKSGSAERTKSYDCCLTLCSTCVFIIQEMEKQNAAEPFDRSSADLPAGVRSHATFDVVRSPASFAPDEREVLRLSVSGAPRDYRDHVTDSHERLSRHVKSASPAGG